MGFELCDDPECRGHGPPVRLKNQGWPGDGAHRVGLLVDQRQCAHTGFALTSRYSPLDPDGEVTE